MLLKPGIMDCFTPGVMRSSGRDWAGFCTAVFMTMPQRLFHIESDMRPIQATNIGLELIEVVGLSSLCKHSFSSYVPRHV